jgi:hypothetical protein
MQLLLRKSDLLARLDGRPEWEDDTTYTVLDDEVTVGGIRLTRLAEQIE